MQISDLWTKIARLYGSQTSPVNFCMQNSIPSIRIISLYVSQASSVVFAWKSATFGPKLCVSMGPRPHSWISACKTACLASELLVSILVPALICGFCMRNSDFLTRITNLYGSHRSLVVLCKQYIVISNRFTCLYRSQPLTVAFAGKTANFGPEQQVSMGPRHPLALCACKTAWLASE